MYIAIINPISALKRTWHQPLLQQVQFVFCSELSAYDVRSFRNSSSTGSCYRPVLLESLSNDDGDPEGNSY